MSESETSEQKEPQLTAAVAGNSAPKVPMAVRREMAAADALRTYVRDLYFNQFGSVIRTNEPMTLILRARVSPGDKWGFRFDPPLHEQVGEQLEEFQALRAAYREGRVYCFRCESADCQHAIPPSPLSVFVGYAPNGTPEWSEMAQVLLDQHDERVDVLHRSVPGVVALILLGRDLKKRQLSSFGRSSKTYSVLGQVAAGYFLLDRSGKHAEKTAITFQIVEVRGAHGEIELKLNTIMRAPPSQSVIDLLCEGWQPAVARARDLALKQIGNIQENIHAAAAMGDREAVRRQFQRVPAILRSLADSLERGYRQECRRTRHAEDRRKERPVHKALDDLRLAPLEAFFMDEKSGTMAVCSSQGRVHVFAPNGRHVTSLRLRPSVIDQRLRIKRWRPASSDEIARFREQILSYMPHGSSQAPQT